MSDQSHPKYPAAEAKLEDVVAEKQGILNPNDSVQQAGDKMRSLGVNALPVSEGRRLIGIVDQEHSEFSAAGRGHDPKTLTVRDAMNRNLVYCLEEDDCATALQRMEEHHLDHITVVDPQLRILGMLHRKDLGPAKEAEKSRRKWR